MNDWSQHSIRVRALELALERARNEGLGNNSTDKVVGCAKEYEEFILGKKGDGDGK